MADTPEKHRGRCGFETQRLVQHLRDACRTTRCVDVVRERHSIARIRSEHQWGVLGLQLKALARRREPESLYCRPRGRLLVDSFSGPVCQDREMSAAQEAG